ncbi:MAG: radical SAM protein [Planctomycetes bacterium]|nr:radical SAM protein [Planctomycetota bacterium]
MPTSVEWEITTHCNLECTMCGRSFGISAMRESRHVDPATFRDLLSKLPFLELVSFRGAGEPILHPQIIKIAGEVVGRGIKLSIFTNGMAMNKALAEQLLAIPVHEIIFSIDAGNPDTYARIRKGGNLDHVLENLKYTADLIQAHPNGTKLSAMFILMRSNYREFPKLLDRINRNGVSALFAKHVNPGFDPKVAEEILRAEEEREFRETLKSLNNRKTKVVYTQELYE